MRLVTVEDVMQQMVDRVKQRRLLSTGQVADVLHCSEATVKRWCDLGKIACHRTPGRQRKIQVTALVSFMNSLEGQKWRLADEPISFQPVENNPTGRG